MNPLLGEGAHEEGQKANRAFGSERGSLEGPAIRIRKGMEQSAQCKKLEKTWRGQIVESGRGRMPLEEQKGRLRGPTDGEKGCILGKEGND